MSLTDGFHRRFVVGTLLRPLAIATDYDYWLFATFSFLVLAGLLAVLVRCALRTEVLGRRVLVIAFFLLPTGHFLFHTVGYLDHVLYLMLFAGIWFVGRERLVLATAVMAVAPLVHEIAILTIIPIFGVVSLRRLPVRDAIAVTLIPAAINLLVLVLPAASDGAVATLAAALERANFAFRPDALELFERSQSDNWRLYDIHEIVVRVKPVAMFAMGAYACLWWFAGGFWRPGQPLPPLAIFFASWIAIGLPGLLVYAGWDHNRWNFLILANFFLVVWISLDDMRGRASRAGAIVLVTALLVFSHVRLDYFPPWAPRELGYREVRWFVRDLQRGLLFQKPPL